MSEICHDCDNPAWTGQTIEAPAMPSSGDGGTTNFNALENRPKYDGTRMTGNTNIPDWTDEIETLQGDVEDIQALIPETATTENQLADQDFVNSSIATNTANFVGTYETLEELEEVESPSNNDYGFVIGTDEEGNTTYNRYKYVSSLSSWEYEYTLNNSSFTAAQWAAITSGITSSDVTLLNSLVQIFSIGTGLNLDANGNLSQKLYTETGDNEDASMTQKATTEAIEEAQGLAKVLSESDYNYPTNDPDGVALWLLAPGVYVWESGTKVYGSASVSYTTEYGSAVISEPSSSGKVYGLVKRGDGNLQLWTWTKSTGAMTSDGVVLASWVVNNLTSTSTSTPLSAYQGKVLKEMIGTLSSLDTTDQTDIVSAINEVLGDIPAVVQTTGTSTTDVMSQNAVTSMVFADPSTKYKVSIGATVSNGSYGVGIGYGAIISNVEDAVAIGSYASGAQRGSVALGSHSGNNIERAGTVDIGTNYILDGYNSGSYYRLLTGLYDPQSDHDAANKEYVDSAIEEVAAIAIRNAGAPTTSTVGTVGQLLEDTTNGDVYICTDATNPYVWEKLVTASELSEAAFGTTETYTIADSDWRLLSSSSPYKYYTTVSATSTVGSDTIVELLNDQPILFAKYGFAIASVVNQVVTLYAVALPTSSTVLNINYRG